MRSLGLSKGERRSDTGTLNYLVETLRVYVNDSLFKVWNVNAETALGGRSRVMDKIHSLLPGIKFIAEFYKRKNKKYQKPLSWKNNLV